jgi:hypothetical protein
MELNRFSLKTKGKNHYYYLKHNKKTASNARDGGKKSEERGRRSDQRTGRSGRVELRAMRFLIRNQGVWTAHKRACEQILWKQKPL